MTGYLSRGEALNIRNEIEEESSLSIYILTSLQQRYTRREKYKTKNVYLKNFRVSLCMFNCIEISLKSIQLRPIVIIKLKTNNNSFKLYQTMNNFVRFSRNIHTITEKLSTKCNMGNYVAQFEKV